MRWEIAAEISDIGRQRDSGTAMPTATETDNRCGVRWIYVAGSFCSTAQDMSRRVDGRTSITANIRDTTVEDNTRQAREVTAGQGRHKQEEKR
jgi:hypothetical protein